jgi:Short C-terminal domain
MQELTPGGEQVVQNLAQRYRISGDAVRAMLYAVSAGGGTMAQFYIPELGGGGQWMRGGMTMVGDMFNSGLQATVSGLCAELSSLLATQQVFAPPPPAHAGGGFISPGNAWWPAELGSPSSSGGQNGGRYAYFPGSQRLAVDRNGHVTVYNTLDHNIGGVQQQQGGQYGSMSFSSQFGTFGVESLPIVSPVPAAPPAREAPAPQWQPPPAPPPSVQNPVAPPTAPPSFFGAPQSQTEILSALERLGQLYQQGVLSESEFKAKKTDLLARL